MLWAKSSIPHLPWKGNMKYCSLLCQETINYLRRAGTTFRSLPTPPFSQLIASPQLHCEQGLPLPRALPPPDTQVGRAAKSCRTPMPREDFITNHYGSHGLITVKGKSFHMFFFPLFSNCNKLLALRNSLVMPLLASHMP